MESPPRVIPVAPQEMRASADEGRGVTIVPNDEQNMRLDNVIGWVRIAKENLPAINDGQVAADRIARMSALLDRLFESAIRARVQLAAERHSRAA